MEPGGSMPHSRVLSNNPCPELIHPNFPLIPISLRSILPLSFHINLGLAKALFSVGVSVNI
jgi:hypothetical protein